MFAAAAGLIGAAAFVAGLWARRRSSARVLTVGGMAIECPPDVDESLLCNFAPLLEWQRNMARGLLADGATLERVRVRDAYRFGPRIGFLWMDVRVHMHGAYLPGAVLLRGKSIAVLLWFRQWVTDKVHVVLVRQPRVATGRTTWEVPAGMADGAGTLRSQAFRELEEETGLTVNVDQLRHHTACGPLPYTSSGVLDETLDLYSMRVSPNIVVSSSTLRGNRAEGEAIVAVEAVPIDDARALEDGKLRTLLSTITLE